MSKIVKVPRCYIGKSNSSCLRIIITSSFITEIYDQNSVATYKVLYQIKSNHLAYGEVKPIQLIFGHPLKPIKVPVMHPKVEPSVVERYGFLLNQELDIEQSRKNDFIRLAIDHKPPGIFNLQHTIQ